MAQEMEPRDVGRLQDMVLAQMFESEALLNVLPRATTLIGVL